MALRAGDRLGAYEVLTPLGEGGMGEVYRARDSRLKREVALKILPESFATDPDRVARFQREAEVLASLNHPHVAAIYGLEDAPSTGSGHAGPARALVLELVEGETLAERIARGPIPVDEALAIARQVADGLQAAHEQGIIHRDLKPANIKVTPDGVVKILDFGLARLSDPAHAIASSSAATLTSPAPMTGVGMILGTAAYMAPEQAKGRTADKRSDAWAFGCVVYEMLTAKRAFEGEDITDTIAAIMRGEPDWSALPPQTPAAIRALLHRCLERDRGKRIADVAAATFAIDEAAQLTPGASSLGSVSPSRPMWRRAIPIAASSLLAATMGAGAAWLILRDSALPPHVSRLQILTTSPATLTIDGTLGDVAITPDGSRIVYGGANGATLFVRALDRLKAATLVGLGTPRGPFVSPDGQWVGFVDGLTTLKKVTTAGGPPVTLATVDGNARGASWGADDTIVFATSNAATGLQRVSAGGGEPIVLTRPDRTRGEGDHLLPEFLPGGRAVLFTILSATGGLDQAHIAVLDVEAATVKVLIQGGTHAHYVPSGHLLFASAGALHAVAFDLARLAVAGTPVQVVPQVVTGTYGSADVAVASDATTVYVPGGVAGATRTLIWIDRRGQETAIAAPPRAYQYPRLSPDGGRAAIFINDQQSDIWTWTLARSALTRVTFDASIENYPVWAPDGRRMLYASGRTGQQNLFAQSADGTGGVERLTESPRVQLPTSISPDGKRVVFTENASATGQDVMQLLLDGKREVTPLVRTPFTERNGEISPDGRWLAYESDASGRFETYVRPFIDGGGGQWQVSSGGGTRPLWARNGQELFYLGPAGALMRVGLVSGSAWSAGEPTKLFDGVFVASGATPGRTYDISPDGRRFLMIKQPVDPSASPASMVVIQHWGEELKRLAPVSK